MNTKGVTFNPDNKSEPPKEVVKEVVAPARSTLTSQLSQFNRPRCGCGKTKNPPYCDGSHARG